VRKRILFKIARYGFYLIITVILIVIIFLYKRVDALEETLKQAIEQATAQAIVQINTTEAAVLEELGMKTEAITGNTLDATALVIYEITAGTTATGRRIMMTDEGIQRINAVYAGILAELEKRTLDSLYTEAVLIDMEQEAGLLFKEGKYMQASTLYKTLADAQPENTGARFFYLYSLFLGNKMDRANYSRIKEGFLVLERNGYERAEIRDVLEFIDIEERGLERERFQ